MKRRLILPLIALIILTISCTFSFELGRPDNYEIVTVEAAKGWTKTGMIVGSGDVLSIEYISGT